MLNRSGLLGVAAVGLSLGVASVASAERLDLLSYSNPSSADLSQISVWMDVTESGDWWNFTFHNDSAITSSITDIWFEVGLRNQGILSTGSSSINIVNETGVSFVKGAASDAPHDSSVISWAGRAFSFGAESGWQRLTNGINPGEQLTISIKKAASIALAELIDLLDEPNTRIALRVKGIGGDKTVAASYVASASTQGQQGPLAVPLPAAVWPGLALLAGLSLRRRHIAA